MRILSKEQKAARKAYKAQWHLDNKDKCNAKSAAWRKENPERAKQLKIEWKNRNPEKKRASNEAWAKANPEKQAAAQAAWARNNKDRKNAHSARWRGSNQDVMAEFVARRKAYKITATPKWADIAEIRKIYRQAVALNRISADSHHVDHIVPLKSSLVCGLHTHHNLQILPGVENCAKGNRFWPNMP